MQGFHIDYEDEKYGDIWIEDRYFDEALQEVTGLYENDKNSIFYTKQLEVILEKKYYHWITYKVLKYMKDLGKLKVEKRERPDGTAIQFYIHPTNRYPKRKINRMEKIINEYSREIISRSCGKRAEDLFGYSLMKNGFKHIDNEVTEFRGKKWKETEHDLDFIFERDGISYGCEIKNTLSYIDKYLLDIKLKMCEFFNIKPLFITRYSPGSYMKEINDRGGFNLIFRYKLFELSQKDLVERIKEELGLPADCPAAIYEGTINRFEDWHKKQKKV